MSTRETDAGTATLGATLARLRSPRTFALAGAVGLLFSFLSVLYGVVSVTGGRAPFLAVVAVAALAAVLARRLRVRTVAWLTGLLFAGGLAAYLVSLPELPTPGPLVASNVELLSGRSVYRVKQTELWALAVTPAPVFLTLYLALRRRYAGAAAAGGLVLGFFILTTDAGTTLALLGVVSATAMVGFGDIDDSESNGAPGAAQAVAVVLALMVLAPLIIPAVPASGGGPLSLTGGGDPTVEASLLTADSQLQVLGSISLSPEVRFTVDSPVRTYWRVGSYDFYTGDGWVRDDETRPYSDRLPSPPGPAATVTQQYTVESDMAVMPAAWRPISVGNSVASNTRVTDTGGLRPAAGFSEGDAYSVTSEVPRPSANRLAGAGTDYPDRVAERYTQLPADTPDRVAERTARLTAEADNPYEVARTVEAWLENNKEYSLSVDRPDGNIADSFLFEMDAGYCTYYATTMVTMLRSQDIPARFVVGYTPGEQSGSDRYVVRGYNSHAWVEVYFPDTGWVRFDPTPADARREAERERLSRARANDAEDIDPDRTPTPTPTPTDTDAAGGGSLNSTPTVTVDVDVDLAPETPTPANGTDGGGFQLPDPPSREELLLGLVVVAGAVAGLRRTGLSRRFGLWARGRLDRDGDPEAAIERAFARLELHLERRHRPRREGETVRAYLDDIDADPEVRRLARLRERARYRGEATEGMAADAQRLLAAVRRDTSGDAATGAETAASGG